jgi:hypothetical protein
MAKNKKSSETKGSVHDGVKAGIQALMAHAMRASGAQVCLASDLADRVWGLPCDHISYRWLSDNTCYQMGKIFGVAGLKESCKSAYAMSMAKLWMDAGGICIYIDTENKKSPVLYKAVVGEANTQRTLDYVSFSTEEWQEQLIDALNFSKDDPHLKDSPVMVIVDSLGGVDTEESRESIEKEGSAKGRSTGGMIKCKSHNAFFRYISKELFLRPHALTYINHLSDDPMSPIQGAKKKPGGTGQDYHAVLDFWFSVVKSTPVYKATRGFTEKILKIKVNKNSMGTSQRNVEIPYRWSKDPDSGEMLSCWFDWDAATAILLADDSPTGVKGRLKDILTVTENSNKYSCKELGLVAVTDSDLGKAVRENVEIRERISDALGIIRMKVWEGLGLPKEVTDIYEKSRYRGPTPEETPKEE